MKKVFKASLLSLGVAAAFGANAATLIVQEADKLVLSNQGIEVENVVTQDVVFDTVVEKNHSGLSQIVVTLGEAVDLSGVTGGSCGAPTTGTFTCGTVEFSVGTGSFTFDNVVVDADAGTLTYAVSLGNSMTAGSSYRTTIGGTVVRDVFSVDFASNLNGNAIEEGSAVIATAIDQFASKVETEFDGVIERVESVTFVRNGETETTDTFAISFTDKAADTANAADVDTVVVTLKGDFAANPVAAFAAATGVVAAVPDDEGRITVTYDTAAWAAIANVEGGDVLTYTYPGSGTIGESKFEVESVVITYSGTAADPVEATLLSAVDAGSWNLDAAVINVPYLPLGYGLTPNVEIANESNRDAEIMIKGFDQNGVVYPTVTLAKIAKGKSVTKVSEADIQAAFGLAATAKTKVSVTFMVDADLEDVTLVPYYKEGTSRINVLADQYKSDTAKGNATWATKSDIPAPVVP